MTVSPERFLGIDHGTRRIGLAFGDSIGVATPLPALAAQDDSKRWAGLAAVIKERRITDIVLGLPLNMDGSSGPKALEVEGYARLIKAEFGLPVHLVDERLTSYEAESTIPPSKRREVRKSGLIDSRAATIILQDYLDSRFPAAAPENDEQ
jgi:putative Holliday junction resolvase